MDSRPVALRGAELEEPEPRPTPLLLLRYGAATALGAFLLFQVEPLLAQALLPRFGGASSVWAACVVVFQVLLLAGYAYAHLLDRWSTGRQAMIHTGVLLVSLLFLPITAMHESARAEAGEPVFRIVKLVLRNVGLPYLILAATGPLLQSWFARETRAAPYRFYALSNAASLLGLLTYPVLMQPLLDLPGQDRLWSVSYALFVLLLLTDSGAAFRNRGGRVIPREQRVTFGMESRAERALWIALPAAASMLLLGITNEMTSEMAAVPFLWVLPLAVYLVTFILAFEKPGWYSRRVLGPLFGLCLLAWTPRLLFFPFEGLPNLLLCLVTLFLAAWICHGELIRLRPAPERVTGFYLSIAAGGALGGILVGLVAPLVFTGYWEVPLGLFAALLLFLVSLYRDPASPWQGGKPARVWTWLVIGTGVAGPLVFAGPLLAMWNYDHQERNFYGVLQIGDQRSASGETMRVLLNGSTVHGTQFLSPLARRFPTTYYGAGSGIALALLHHPKRAAGEPLRVGAIGLGAGTIAAWGRTGDLFRFYEIDPAVVAAARSSFTFLADSHAAIETVLGDGRLSLSREAPERTRFDVLAVDAFSGGSIPTHLLTRESFAIYRKVLAPDGIIAVHVSNRYLRLAPVVRGAAVDAGLPAMLVVQNANSLTGLESNDWVLITANDAFRQEIASRVTPWSETQKPVLWTDQKTSLLRVLR